MYRYHSSWIVARRLALSLAHPGPWSVILPSITVDLLKQHRMSQQQAKSEAGEYWQVNDLVFCTALGTPLNPNKLLEPFETVLKRADLPHIR